MSSCVLALTFLLTFIHSSVGKFIAPSPSFEALSPTGFKVSIPDAEGITLFGFHGSPFPMHTGQVGIWARDVTKPTQGHWTYTNRDAPLKIGDKIHFWTYIVYDGAGYREEDGEWTVKSLINKDDVVDPDVQYWVDLINLTSTQHSIDTPKFKAKGSKKSNSTKNTVCEESASEVHDGEKICSGDLLFDSNFNEIITLDGKWTPEVVFPEAPDYPFVVYMKGDHISMENGLLIIKPVLLEERFGEGFIRKSLALEGCTGKVDTLQCKKNALGSQILPPIISGKLTTKDSFNFKYGRVEVRAKLPKGNWILPEILLEPRDKKYGSSHYASGIMKIASIKGNENYSGQLVGGIIMHDRDPFRSFGLRTRKGLHSWNNDFHNYTLIWTPENISLYVDGDNYGNVQESQRFSEIGKEMDIEAASEWARGSKIAPFDEMFHISLGIRAGGVNDFQDEMTKPWKNKSHKAVINFWKSRNTWEPTWSQRRSELQVEYVRIYAL